MPNQHDIVRQFTEWAATADYPERVKSVSCKWHTNNSYELDLCMKNSSVADIKYFVYPKRRRYSMWLRKPTNTDTGTDTNNQRYVVSVSDYPYPRSCRRLPSLIVLIYFTTHSFYLFD